MASATVSEFSSAASVCYERKYDLLSPEYEVLGTLSLLLLLWTLLLLLELIAAHFVVVGVIVVYGRADPNPDLHVLFSVSVVF